MYQPDTAEGTKRYKCPVHRGKNRSVAVGFIPNGKSVSRLWQAAESICCQLKRISPPCAETWRWLFPLLGTERAGGPTVPPWLAAEWRARGVKLTVWADAPVNRRHGRLERRELWALADPELNGYVGSAGTVGEAWPHLQQVCRLERQRVVKGKKQVAVSYAISSLPATDADARRLLSLSRGHWGHPTGSGGPAEPGHQLGTSGWAFQHSRCPTPPQCPSQQSFRHDGLYLPGRRMKRPWGTYTAWFFVRLCFDMMVPVCTRSETRRLHSGGFHFLSASLPLTSLHHRPTFH